MNFRERVEDETKKIVEKLKREGWANSTINYETFLKLYDDYKNTMSKEEFAQIIGLNHNKLKFMRTRKTKSVILKQSASQELKDEIKERLIADGYANKSNGNRKSFRKFRSRWFVWKMY